MRKKILIGILLATILVASGCVRQQPENETVKVGAILPLTGAVSYYGDYFKKGIELGVEEVNAGGGINGRPLEVVYEDSQADTKQGVSAYRKLAEQGSIKVILTTISGVTLGMAPLAEEDQVVVLSVGSASTEISKAGDYIFRHNLLPQEEARLDAETIYDYFLFKEIGLIYVNADAGLAYKEAFEEKFQELGGKIRLAEAYERNATDFRTQLEKIKESNVKAVMAISYTQELGFILKQAKELGIDVQWFGFYDSEGPKLLEIAGNAAEGLIYSHFFNPEAETALAKQYFQRHEEKYGIESESYAALCFDSIRVLAEAMKNCPDPEDATCIKNELYKIKDFPGVTGKITFNESGDTEKEIILKTVKNNEFVPYGVPE